MSDILRLQAYAEGFDVMAANLYGSPITRATRVEGVVKYLMRLHSGELTEAGTAYDPPVGPMAVAETIAEAVVPQPSGEYRHA